MASRSVKKTTVKTTTTSSGHGEGLSTPSSSGTQSPGRHRAPSPARLTRIQEKQELQNLNDRLANYIDRVRYLENENSRLLVQVRQTEETVTREVSSIKNLYEGELADARKSLDDVAKEKARLQIEATKSRSQADEALSKFHRKDNELKDALKRIADLEAQVADLSSRLADAESKKTPLEKQVASLRSENRALESQLAKVRKQLEEESLMRVDLENRLQSIKEELAFKGQVHEQELNESRVRMTTTIEEVDGRVQNEYESRLGDALAEMRRDQDYQVNIAKEEIISLYESKMGDLQSQAERSEAISQTIRDELRLTKRRLDEVNSELTKLRNQNSQYENRITDLENQLKREQDEYFITLKYKDEEIKRLHVLLDEQTQEYSDLLDVKLKLDMEIAAYRKLLEGEEARLNLSQSFEATPRRAVTPSKARGKKRKMTTSQNIHETSQSSSSSGYGTSSMAKGSVEVHDVDVEGGKFISLYNNSDKDVPIGGWQLKHIGEDQETTYKFHRNTVSKAGQTVTVWSADSEQTHDPPSHLVMKGQRWFIGEKMKTLLLDTKGDEMAAREMNKSLLKSVSSYRSSIVGPRDDQDSDEGVETDKEKCSIM